MTRKNIAAAAYALLALALLGFVIMASPGRAQNATQTTAPINVTTATTTQIIAPSGANRATTVTAMHYIVGAADNLTWEWSLTAGCASGVTTFGGSENYGANGGSNLGDGAAIVLVVPPQAYLCLLTSTNANVGGWVAYAQ